MSSSIPTSKPVSPAFSYAFQNPPHNPIVNRALEQASNETKASVSNMSKPLQTKKTKNYYWSNAENKRYILALKRYQKLLSMPTQKRRLKNMNVLISRKIRTRDPNQCHSHHQKMLKKYGSIQKIIKELDINSNEDGKVSMHPREEYRPKGRPRKVENFLARTPTVESCAEKNSEPTTANDDILFDILELGVKEFEEQQDYKYIENTWREAFEANEMIYMEF